MDIQKMDLAGSFADAAQRIQGQLAALPSAALDDFDPQETVLAVIDMNNGFAKGGALYSPYVEAIIPAVRALTTRCREKNILSVLYTDCHDPQSPEFASFPPHCVRGSGEEQIIDELRDIEGVQIVEKASTNGFYNWYIKELLDTYEIKKLIVCGCVTDICVYQFCQAVKTYCTQNDRELAVVVPLDCVDTYDIPGVHGRDFANAAACASLLAGGITLVRHID